MRGRRLGRLAAWVLLASALVLVGATALARPGGGDTFSGAPSGGGSGGGDDGGLVFYLIWLCFEHPTIGVPLLLVFLLVSWLRKRGEAKQKAWQTSEAGVPHVQQQTRAAAGVSRTELDAIRSIDPAFSSVLFEDFVYHLYAEMQRARALGTAALEAFLAPALAQALRAPYLSDVRGVVIGALRIVRFSGVGGAMVHIELELDANYSEVDRSGREQRFYVVDRLSLGRARTARSRPTDRARTLDCPNCGAPLENLQGTTCRYCRQEVGGGRFDWSVEHLRTLRKDPRGPLLTSDTVEVGTDLPTRVDPGVHARMQSLSARDPAFRHEAFQRRVGLIHEQLQLGWSRRDPALLRPYVSDNLLQSMLYWIDLYKHGRCRNVTEGARVLRIDLANVLSDATYDAITVRVFATGADYTVSDDGKLLSGDRSKPRTYSEYWTLIRGVGVKGGASEARVCPSCGAELNISMVGNCTYCRVKVTAGAFDWVLSRIEQDEAYAG